MNRKGRAYRKSAPTLPTRRKGEGLKEWLSQLSPRQVSFIADRLPELERLDAEVARLDLDMKSKLREAVVLAGGDPGMVDHLVGRIDNQQSRAILSAALEASGWEPEFVHAVVVTGLVVSERDRDKYTSEELARWDAAVTDGKALYVKDVGHRAVKDQTDEE